MVFTGLDVAIEAAARAIAHSAAGLLTSVSVTTAVPDEAAAAACTREAEALAVRFGVHVAVQTVPGGLTLRFSAISAARPERARPTAGKRSTRTAARR